MHPGHPAWPSARPEAPGCRAWASSAYSLPESWEGTFMVEQRRQTRRTAYSCMEGSGEKGGVFGAATVTMMSGR